MSATSLLLKPVLLLTVLFQFCCCDRTLRARTKENKIFPSNAYQISRKLSDTNAPAPIPPLPTPTFVPTTNPQPILPSICKIPKLLGKWERFTACPLNALEGQGAMVANGNFVIISGFSKTIYSSTREVYALDTTNTNLTWSKMDDIPEPIGISHMSTAVNGNIIYTCGGYVGGHPGRATNVCLQYDHLNSPGNQWKNLPNLPGPRAGGVLLYDSLSETLLYATGASRTDPNRIGKTQDHDDVWELDLRNLNNGWITKTSLPYKGNHLGDMTVMYNGIERHFVMGGQLAEEEDSTNQNYLYEWDRINGRWLQLANLPVGRGHITASVVRYNDCGFFVICGRTNTGVTSEVTYYDIGSNTWSNVGKFRGIKAITCDVHNNTIYCQSATTAAKINII